MEDFSVMRSSRSLVRPAATGGASSGMQLLDLSAIDRLPVLRCNARTLHVFRHGGSRAAKVIREALAKALVPYYPLAGRLHLHQQHQQQLLQIACCGEGVWFVEASANSTLHALNYFDHVSSHDIPYDKLLPDYPHNQTQTQTQTTQGDTIDDPLILMQVTQFACDGFVIGLTFCHSICDGLGAAQFLNAVGELARGLDHLTVAPVWQRDFLPPPPPPAEAAQTQTREQVVVLQRAPPMPNYRLEHANIDIPLDRIKELKQKYQESTGQTCSAFEIVAAILWKNRTRVAIINNSNEEENTQVVKLVFFANCRQLLQPPLPEGFYGNCFFPVTITATSETLSRASNAHVVKMIQEAKANLPIEFGKWTTAKGGGGGGGGEGDPFAPPLAYTTLFISEWGRLGFNEVDYGWGPPVHVIPVQGSAVIPVAIVGSLPSPNKGIRLMTWCVESPHLQPFLHQMAANL